MTVSHVFCKTLEATHGQGHTLRQEEGVDTPPYFTRGDQFDPSLPFYLELIIGGAANVFTRATPASEVLVPLIGFAIDVNQVAGLQLESISRDSCLGVLCSSDSVLSSAFDHLANRDLSQSERVSGYSRKTSFVVVGWSRKIEVS